MAGSFLDLRPLTAKRSGNAIMTRLRMNPHKLIITDLEIELYGSAILALPSLSFDRCLSYNIKSLLTADRESMR
jgi:hypothetical protein